MFQGLAVIRPADLPAANFRNTYPVGPRYVANAIQDFDDDGRDDLLLSQWNPVAEAFQLQLVDLVSMQTKATYDGLMVQAIVSDAGGRPMILARATATENGSDTNNLVVLEFRDHEFHKLWSLDYASPFYSLTDHDPRPDVENPGLGMITFDAVGNGSVDLLLRGGAGIEAHDIRTGRIVASYKPQHDEPITFVKRSTVDDSLFVSFADGEAAILTPGFRPSGLLRTSGYLRLFSTNNHGGSVAVAADLDGDGHNELYATTSTNELLRIDDTKRNAATDTVVFSGIVPLQPVALRDVRSLFLKSCPGSLDNICRLSDGILSWYINLPELGGGSAIPTSINIGRRSPSARTLFTSRAAVSPQPVYAYDVDTGEHLWTSDYGTSADGSFAIFDFNHDGVDDVAFNADTNKGYVIDGRDGSLLSNPALLPPYGVLGYVDYNGVPLVIDIDGTGYILDVEDNAHEALLRPATSIEETTEIIWSVPQAAIDDERHAMPAVAPDEALGAIVGGGSRRGVFIARNALTGEDLWRHEVYHGQFASSDAEHAIGSTIAVDVDGRDGVDFVFGSDDGYLYALNARTGNLVWSVNLGYPVGDPIAADVDGDGTSEIIVAAADGKLHVIGNGQRRRTAR